MVESAESIDTLYQKSKTIRRRFLDIFTHLGYGHLTTAFSETEILITLLEKVMNYRPQAPDSDRLYISKGHGAGMMFPILEDVGVLSEEEIKTMLIQGGDFSVLNGLYYPGFAFYGGSLGIGLGMAAGQAYGAKISRNSYLTFCLVGDAECYEGSIWEAALFAAHNRLNNLIVIVDRNYLGCSDFTENMCELEPFADKWKSFGWEVKTVNGHSYEELLEAFKGIRSRKSVKPLCVVAETVKGEGVDWVSDIPLMHGYMPKGEKIDAAYKALDAWEIR